jgi:hypothetical protein
MRAAQAPCQGNCLSDVFHTLSALIRARCVAVACGVINCQLCLLNPKQRFVDASVAKGVVTVYTCGHQPSASSFDKFSLCHHHSAGSPSHLSLPSVAAISANCSVHLPSCLHAPTGSALMLLPSVSQTFDVVGGVAFHTMGLMFLYWQSILESGLLFALPDKLMIVS